MRRAPEGQTKEDMADDDVLEDEGELDDAVIDTDATSADDEQEEDGAVPAQPGSEEDDDDADPDDIEEDLDTILRDRIAAGADENDDEDEEEAAAHVAAGGTPNVAQRAAKEFACKECFLLVRRSQFAPNRTDCPGGLDGADCPVKNELALVPT